ncbi:MAG: hypothetical protein QMB24_11030 [Spirosomataceae bacterium]|jgi:hypothetical protein
MRRIITLISIVLFIVACNDWSFPPKCDDCGFICLQEDELNVFTNRCPLGFTCEYNVYTDSKVDISEPSGISKGRNTVFEMITYTEAVASNINDDIRRTMIFEIPTDQRTFYVSPEDLTKTRAHLKTECICPTTQFVSGELGCIAGEMQFDGVWFVYGKVSFTYPYGTEEMKFEARFDEVKKTETL